MDIAHKNLGSYEDTLIKSCVVQIEILGKFLDKISSRVEHIYRAVKVVQKPGYLFHQSVNNFDT